MNNALAQLTQIFKGAFQWWVLLTPWEQALRVRRGKNVTELNAGLHLRIPLIDRLFIQSVRLRMTDTPIQTVTTKDGSTITLKAQLGYRIDSLRLLYDTLHDAEGTIMNLVQMEIANHICVNMVVDLTPMQIVMAVQGSLIDRLAAFGLGDICVSITDFAIVKTYRLITQDIWTNSGAALDTFKFHGQAE